MEGNGASRAQRGMLAPKPTGFRRLTPELLRADRSAEAFAGVAENLSPGQLLAAFKAAAPRLGLSPRLVHAVDWLFRFTQSQDWRKGERPIVWPSASMQQEALGLSASRVKAINRGLIEAGLITMKDSPNGKRYGRRDQRGHITEAYGFDLSPIATRHPEFVRLAEEAMAERMLTGRLRRRATIARKGITQILETVAEYGLQDEEWRRLACDSRDMVKEIRSPGSLEALATSVLRWEHCHGAARERLESLLLTMDSDPKGTGNEPHHNTYNSDSDPKDTVIAQEQGSWRPPTSSPTVAATAAAPKERGRVLRLHPDELVRLVPRLRPYLRRASPTWPEIVDAADWLRHELDISKPLWGEACLVMGREEAAVAMAVVSTKDREHFRTTPGGYFHGMVAKAKAGELNLDRTLWAMRRAAASSPVRTERRRGL